MNDGLLRPGSTPDQFVFGPRLLFDVAYSTIPPTRRQRLHRIMADHLLDRIDDGEQTLVHTAAHHAYIGYSDQRAANLLLDSATLYKSQYSLRQSIGAAQRAIEVIASLPDAADHQRQRLEALLLLAQCHEVIGELDQAEASIAEAEVLAEECDDQRLMANVLTTAGTLLLMQADPDGAEYRYSEALAIWQRLESATRAAHMMVGMGLCAGQRGDRERATTLFRQAAETEDADEWVRAAAENNLGVMLIELGRYEEAEPHLLRGLAANERDDDLRGVAQSWCSLGELFYRLARLDEAEAALGRAVKAAEEAEDTPCLLLAHGWQTRVSCLRGEAFATEMLDEACAHLPPECAAAVRIAGVDCVLRWGAEQDVRDQLSSLAASEQWSGNASLELLALGVETALIVNDTRAIETLSAYVRNAWDDATDVRLKTYARWLLQIAENVPELDIPAAEPATCFTLRATRVVDAVRIKRS